MKQFIILVTILMFSITSFAVDMSDFEFYGNRFADGINIVGCYKSTTEYDVKVRLISSDRARISPKCSKHRRICKVMALSNSDGFSYGHKSVKKGEIKWAVCEDFPGMLAAVSSFDRNLEKLVNDAKNSNNVSLLKKINSQFLGHHLAASANRIANSIEIKQKNKMEEEKAHVLDKYTKASSFAELKQLIYNYNTNKKIGLLRYKDVISADKIAIAIKKTFPFVRKANNISGYKWFIDVAVKSRTNGVLSKDAMNSIHNLAYMQAEDIDTLESYNDFIIAYPYAKEVSKATKKAYNIENDKHSSWLTSNEKQSRALLIQSKRLSRKMKSASIKDGYFLVINRMDELLQDKFPAEEATLRYLESEEFKDFVSSFNRAVKRIASKLSQIANNTKDLSNILKEQSSMMDNHFKNSAQEDKMANYYTKQFQDWERYQKRHDAL